MFENKLQTQAFQIIREKIIFSEFPPGTKISEKNLEQLLNIGRTPIREALLQLRQQELIYTIPQSGTYVSKINLKSANNARFVREQLERKIMIECCSKITKQTSKILITILEEQKKYIILKDSKNFFHTDNLFHEACFEIAERKEVWDWIDHLNTHLERFRWLRVTIDDLDWEKILNQHLDIYESLIKKDTDEVDFLTSLHSHLMLQEQEKVIKEYPQFFIDIQ